VAILIQMPQNEAYSRFDMKEKIVYVKARLQSDLHEKLKTYGKEDKRSMNYLINKAVEHFLKQQENAKA
jgi:predicted DNA-binding protein